MRWVRRYDQDERETDGAVHGNWMGPKLRKAFQKAGGQKFSDSDGLQARWGSSIAWIPIMSCSLFVPLRTCWWEFDSAWVDGSRRYSIQMERIPVSSRMLLWILKSGLISGGWESKEGRQTIFFTPPIQFGDNPGEEHPTDDFSRPRKVHYYSKWKTRQDAVYWINLARAQDKWLRFWQTRSHNCMQLCAGRLHLQSDIWKEGKNLIWKTLDASSRTEDSTQECLAIAAAAASAAARHIWECVFWCTEKNNR